MTDNVDTFLAHYGVKGMRWGQRKTRKEAEAKARQEVMRGKNLDEIMDRSRKEKKLKALVDEDLRPKRTAAKNFTLNLLNEHKGTIASSLAIAGSTAVGMAFMAARLSSSFNDISMSPIPLR